MKFSYSQIKTRFNKEFMEYREGRKRKKVVKNIQSVIFSLRRDFKLIFKAGFKVVSLIWRP